MFLKTNKSLWENQQGLVGAYIRVIISVIMVAIVFIVMNEFVLRLGSATNSISTNPGFSGTSSLLLYLWRMAPIVLLISAIVWAIWVSHREQPGVYG